jgi:hypothetical protein
LGWGHIAETYSQGWEKLQALVAGWLVDNFAGGDCFVYDVSKWFKTVVSLSMGPTATPHSFDLNDLVVNPSPSTAVIEDKLDPE